MSLQQLITSIVNEPLLTRKDLARRYSVSVDTIDDWRREGILPKPVHVGRFPYWRPCEIHDKEESKRVRA
jgi:predicted DNA-binding transcriptional regulator AlpA